MNDEVNQKLPDEVARYRDRILQLAAERGASNVRIFGSMVHGSTDADSDIDFLVDLEPGRSLLDLGACRCNCRRFLIDRST